MLRQCHEVTEYLQIESSDGNYIQVPVSYMVLGFSINNFSTTYKVQLSRGSDSGRELYGTAGSDIFW